MNYKIITKGVSFNILDPDQEKMLDYASKRSNFSSYIKRLIQRDIDNGFVPVQQYDKVSHHNDELDDNLMNDLI